MTAELESSNLIGCPDCGHRCSKSAQTCPNCGRPFVEAAADAPLMQGNNLYDYVFRNSLMMVGLCLTLLGLVRLVEGLKHFGSLGDELLAANSAIFLCSSLVSYFALKQPDPVRRHRAGRWSDVIFSLGIVFLFGICVVVAVSMI